MIRVLAIDDDESFVFGLRKLLVRDGLDITGATSGQEALDRLCVESWDAVLLDLGLPDMSGLDLLRELSARSIDCPVIVLTGRDDARAAVEALRLGAAHYITKPPAREELTKVLAEARERAQIRVKFNEARRASALPPGSVIGDSPSFCNAMADLRASALAPRTPVLLTGESGTGKEIAAAQLHAWSPRASRPFVSVNAACISPSLLESELFGHEAGAFTGAISAKKGLFELAAGGTLFLDEVAELPLALQPKLLRVIEGHPFRRVGGERLIAADVRIVSATNSRMEEAVAKGLFRLDLYHRLRVVEVVLPPLRERGNDCETLAIRFASRMAEELGKPDIEIDPETLAAVRAYSWPGNVRELRNAVERAVVLCRNGRVAPQDLPPEVREVRAPAGEGSLPPSRPPRSRRFLSLDVVIKEHVLCVYRENSGNLARTARELHIGRATLRRYLRDYEVTPAAPAPPRRA